MVSTKRNFEWIRMIRDQLTDDVDVLQDLIRQLETNASNYYSFSPNMLAYGTLDFLKINFLNVIDSKWFLLLGGNKKQPIYKMQLEKNILCYFIKTSDDNLSLMFTEITKGDSVFYIRNNDILLFKKNEPFFSCFANDDDGITRRHFFELNKINNQFLFQKENDDHFMLYFTNKKIKLLKDMKVNCLFAYEYNYLGNETGSFLLTDKHFIDYKEKPQEAKYFLNFENFIYIQYKENFNDKLIDVQLDKKYSINENECRYVFLKQIDKKNLIDELNNWELCCGY